MKPKRDYGLDLRNYRKVIVGEGESDRNFFAAFCAANGIKGFDFAFTGMHSPTYEPSGNTEFFRYLAALEKLAGFNNLTDVILVCDTGDKDFLPALQKQIKQANQTIGRAVFDEAPKKNLVSSTGAPRLHVLMIPDNRPGGLESVCVDVARDHQNAAGGNKGTTIEGWVDTFANSACQNWTTEKRDKLRLQAFLSAAWEGKPDVHFSQLFGQSKDRFVPLTGASFDFIRQFLRAVETL